MSSWDILFWLLIIFILILAFTIESGLSARHRTLVLSSIMSATLAVVYMMFIVEDQSKFETGKAPPAIKEKKKVYVDKNGGEGEGLGDNIEIIEQDGVVVSDDPISRYEDGSLLKKASGFRDCPECPLMVMLPAGKFIIGSPAGEADRRENESPQKLITFNRPFTISRYEIQYKEYAAFVLATRYTAKAECQAEGRPLGSVNWKSTVLADNTTVNHPVVCLTWHDANEYAKWLTEKTKRKYTLPSESEWEYAARGGTSTPYWPGDQIKPEEANFASNNKGMKAVGQGANNAFKLFDVAGNVWEMTDDCWTANLANVPASGVSEQGLGDCKMSAIRGGAWNSPMPEVRSAFRRPISRDQAFITVGFRLAREIK